jgi:phospholipase A1
MFARRNLRTGHGAVRAGWAFPLVAHLKGYVEAFSGYGQTLIDYNHSQTTIGIGVLVSE